MKESTRKKLITALILIVIGLAVAAGVANSRYQASDPQKTIFADYYNSVGWDKAPNVHQRQMMAISDGLMIMGVVYAGVGLLTWVASTGFFDMLSYGFASLWVMFTPFKNPKNHPRFYDYKQARQEKRKSPRLVVLYVGLGFLLAACVFSLLYYI